MNKLAHETSPYLLQHAENPVNWYAWGEEALKIAEEKDKPIIVSIGYSACHWCHVMERESFENEDIASIMNAFFINIKVDREERPDIDAIYMDAIQNMGLNGGWPLNVFLMPNRKPFYGGTYFPPEIWSKILRQIAQAFGKQRHELAVSANQITKNIGISDIIKYNLNSNNQELSIHDLNLGFEQLSKKFDIKEGGVGDAPKFPMPSIYAFLMRYTQLTQNENAQKHAEFTLDKMAFGGIYDQIGGGFARYSTDEKWFAPHFEKMLYDNAQLLGIYSEMYLITKKDLYKKMVEETIFFIQEELTSEEGGFYTALDADTEGEEGKFYVWQAEEIQSIICHDELRHFYDYFNITEEGNWDKNYNILHRKISNSVFAQKYNITILELLEQVQKWKKKLYTIRQNRTKPNLDDKILSSCNGLTIKGLSKSYATFEHSNFLNLAKQNADFIIDKLIIGERRLHRSYINHASRFSGCLGDYACVIEGFIALYQVCFEEKYLNYALNLTEYTLENFFDSNENFFFYTDKTGEKLIARKKEIFDQVIPSSNSIMAENLFHLGSVYDKKEYTEQARKMTLMMLKLIKQDTRYVSNWASLLTRMLQPSLEIIIIGKDYQEVALALHKEFIPHKIICATASESQLPLFSHRSSDSEKTAIFVCKNKTCSPPVYHPKDALKIIHQ